MNSLDLTITLSCKSIVISSVTIIVLWKPSKNDSSHRSRTIEWHINWNQRNSNYDGVNNQDFMSFKKYGIKSFWNSFYFSMIRYQIYCFLHLCIILTFIFFLNIIYIFILAWVGLFFDIKRIDFKLFIKCKYFWLINLIKKLHNTLTCLLCHK